MRNLKKVLSLTLALVMLIGMMVVGAGAATYTDTVDSDKQEAIEVTSAVEIIMGDGNGTFRPDGTLRRSEAAVIIARVLLTNSVVTKLGSTDCQFTDVTDDWAKAPIQYCANVGIINGRSATIFDPNANVTGVEFAKMLMCVLDDTKDYTASRNWKLDVQRDALAAKLDTNDVPLTDAALSREDAAQMAFNAIQYSPSGAKSYKVGSLTFDNVMDAFIAADGDASKIEITTAKDSLASTRFNLTEGTKDDGLGHTLKTWSVNKDEVYAASISSETPVQTYTTEVTSVAKDLNGYTYASGLKATVNGVASSSISNATAIQNLTKNGRTVEVYANSNKVITKVIVIARTVATLSADPSTRDNDGTEQVRVPGAISAWTDASKVTGWEDLAKGDVVLWVKGNNDRYDIKKADTITGTATAYSNTRGVRVDGDYFPASALTGSQISGNSALAVWNRDASDKFTAEYTFYLDEGNCVVKVEKTDGDASTESNYAIVRDVAWFGGSGFNPNGYMQAVILKTDGTYETVDVASVDGVVPVGSGIEVKDLDSTINFIEKDITSLSLVTTKTKCGTTAVGTEAMKTKNYIVAGTTSNGDITKKYFGVDKTADLTDSTAGFIVEDQFYSYSVDSDGKYVLKNLDAANAGSLANSRIVTNTARFDGTNLGNANTVFLFDTGVNKAPDIYTGIGEVPTTSAAPANQTGNAVVKVNGYAKFVFVKGVTAQSASTDFAYIHDANSWVNTSNGKEYTAFINGEEGTITVASDDTVINTSGLYGVLSVNDKDVSTVQKYTMVVGIASNSGNVLTIGQKIGGQEDFVYDDDTVVYVISADGATCDQVVASEIEADANDKVYVFTDNNSGRANTIYVAKVNEQAPEVKLEKGTSNDMTVFPTLDSNKMVAGETVEMTLNDNNKIKLTVGSLGSNYEVTPTLSKDGATVSSFASGTEFDATAGTYVLTLEVKDEFSGSVERYTYTIVVAAKPAESAG